MDLMDEFLVGTAAAVAGGVILAALAWLAGKVVAVRRWFETRPWAIAGLAGFATASLSLFVALVATNIEHREPQIIISVVPDADNVAAGTPSHLTNAAPNKLCVFSKIVKNRGDPNNAGDAIIIRKPDHWEAFSSNILSSAATCYAFTLQK